MKIRTLLFLGIMASAFFYSCEKDEEEKDENVYCFEYTGKPFQAISHAQARNLQREYVLTRADFLNEALINNGTIGKDEKDVRDVTFDFGVLRSYMVYVEKEAKEQGVAPEDLALRVYLGAYPKNFTADGFDKENQGKSTMFFLPINKLKSRPAGKVSAKSSLPGDQLEGVDGLNLGHSGRPPKDLN